MEKSPEKTAYFSERALLFSQGIPDLLKWFKASGRDLPWRQERTPYRIWISESMLQQTRIETVLKYYPRFIERFPSLEELAKAEEDQVLKCWEGLGYYSRAKNLRKAARLCMEQYQGELPERAADLRKLPGVGSYTAGAVASLAFGEAAAAVDGNVLRILARFFNDERDIRNATVRKEAEQLLTEILRRQTDPGAVNEALMELGETLCLPAGRPRCRSCPWNMRCAALAAGTETDLPCRGEAKVRRKEKKTVLLLTCQNRIALEKRPEKGLLAGLYGFPLLEGHLGYSDLALWLGSYGIAFSELKPVGKARHIFTHVEWEMEAWSARTEDFLPSYRYALRDEILEQYALPSAFQYFRENGLDS